MSLRIEGLEFSYENKKVLHDISFDAEDDSIISILGPNGVGKTTLLKCICNIHPLSSGSIRIDGNEVTSMPRRELAKHVAYVPQSVQASNALVFDSVLIGRRPYIEWSVSQKDMELTWKALEALRIEDLAMRYVDELSGGEFQKVQIARAVVQEPRLLILDEPTNNLDIANQHITMHTVINAVRSRGMCTIMTMHDINLAVHYSDKFIFMKNGRIIKSGGTEIIDEALIEETYGIESDVIEHDGVPFVIPHAFPKELAHYHHMHNGTYHSHRTDGKQ